MRDLSSLTRGSNSCPLTVEVESWPLDCMHFWKSLTKNSSFIHVAPGRTFINYSNIIFCTWNARRTMLDTGWRGEWLTPHGWFNTKMNGIVWASEELTLKYMKETWHSQNSTRTLAYTYRVLQQLFFMLCTCSPNQSSHRWGNRGTGKLSKVSQIASSRQFPRQAVWPQRPLPTWNCL